MRNAVSKIERIAILAEEKLTRQRLALEFGDFDRMYEEFNMLMPRKVKIAAWFVM